MSHVRMVAQRTSLSVAKARSARVGSWEGVCVRILATLLLLCAMPCAVLAESVGWLDPSLEAGTFGQPENAFYDDAAVASVSLGNIHQYWGYGVLLPAGSIVHGIEIRVDAEKSTQETAELQLEISWDGGLSWTTTGYSTGDLTEVMNTYIVGSPTDNWGRSWLVSELEDTNLRVRATAASAANGKIIKLDWLALTVSYETQTLGLSTQSIDFSPLTLMDFDTGFQEITPAQTLTVSSTSSWLITIQATSATWSYAGTSEDPVKSCEDLAWRSASADPRVSQVTSAYTGLTTSATLVATGDAGQEIPVIIDARMLVSYAADPPGDYAIEISYVLTTP